MSDIHDIKPIIEISFFGSVLKTGVIILVFLFLITALFWGILKLWVFYKQKKINKFIPPPEQITLVDYYSLAEKGLKQCRDLLIRGNFKEFHLLLNQVVKEYISHKLGVNIINKTISEIRHEEKLDNDLKNELRNFLSVNDPAVFSGCELNENTARNVLEQAEKIINLSRYEV